MEKQLNFPFNLEMLGSVKTVRDDMLERARTYANITGDIFSELSCWAKEIIRAISISPSMKWEYMVDSSTGLKILKSEKDAEALDHVRQLSDELFK